MILDDLKIYSDIFIWGYLKINIMDDHLAHASASIVEDVLDLVQLCHPVIYTLIFFGDPVIYVFFVTQL